MAYRSPPEDVVTKEMMLDTELKRLEAGVNGPTWNITGLEKEADIEKDIHKKGARQVRRIVAKNLGKFFAGESSLLAKTLDACETYNHIMIYTHIRVITALMSMLKTMVEKITERYTNAGGG